MTLPQGVTLTLEADGEVGRYRDARCGLELLIPGGPSLRAPGAGSGGDARIPPCEAEITLARLPIRLVLRLSTRPADADGSVRPLELVRAIAQERSLIPPRPHAAPPEQLGRWGCAAAASAIYPLRPAPDPVPDREGHDDGGADTEEVVVLQPPQGEQLVTLFLRFPAKRLPAPTWALWSSAVLGRLRLHGSFDGVLAEPPLFPPSTFLAPGLEGLLQPECAARIERLQPLAQLATNGDRAARGLTGRCALLLSAKDPPDRPLGPAERRSLFDLLVAGLTDEAAAQALARTLAEVQSAYDLRGFALLLLHVLGARPATFAKTP